MCRSCFWCAIFQSTCPALILKSTWVIFYFICRTGYIGISWGVCFCPYLNSRLIFETHSAICFLTQHICTLSQGTVDDDKSVSAQAGTPVPLTPVLSPRSVESDNSQQRASILQPYTDSATGSIQPLQLHSYDGGGPISPTFTGHGVSSSSPQGLEQASLVLSPSVAMQMHTEAMARLDQKPNTVVYVLGSPNLTTGVVEEGAAGVDTWWT